MKMARRVGLPVCCAISIALILPACPILARQPQGANSNDAKASATGRITAISGEGVTNVLPGVTLKLTGPSAGAAPQSTVTDSEGRYEFTQLAERTSTTAAPAADHTTWSATITLR